jgi:hypothetical protein
LKTVFVENYSEKNTQNQRVAGSLRASAVFLASELAVPIKKKAH